MYARNARHVKPLRADLGTVEHVEEYELEAFRDLFGADSSEASDSVFSSFRKWKKASAYCMCLASAIMLFGYDYAVLGTVAAMPSFQYEFGEKHKEQWILPAFWLALWAAASPLGSMAGALAAGYLGDLWGRRPALAIGSILSTGAVAICYISYIPADINARRGTFLAGKILQGVAIGAVMASTQTYMSEILPMSLRGPVMAFFPKFTLLGQLIGAVVIFSCLNLHQGYKIAFASQWALSILPITAAIMIPESPTYLLRKGRLDQALSAQRRLDPPEVDSVFKIEELRLNLRYEQEHTTSKYIECFRGTNLRRTLVVMFASYIPESFGLTLLGKASYFMEVNGMSATGSIMILMIGISLGIITNVISVWGLSRAGRRPLMLRTLAIASLAWLGMGCVGSASGAVTKWYSGVTLIVVAITVSLGAWPASYAVSAETSSLHLRAKSQGIGWFTAGAATALFGFILPYIYNPDQGNLRAQTGFVFAALCALSCAITWLFVPEMMGRTPMQIDRMYELKLPAKKFRSWKETPEIVQT